MADLFNFLNDTAAPSTSAPCASVEDLETNLRGILADKVTENKAEAVSYTFEIRSAAQFSVVLTEAENESLETVGNIAPGLGGASLGQVQIIDGQMVRTVSANDALMNQPRDDTVLQGTVCKHIISKISACDQSTWDVGEVSRGTQGWTFTYQCKDSFKAWSRANARAEKFIQGEYSKRELDPVAASVSALSIELEFRNLC
jgi:ATP-dependent DNA helicase 2 subunit 1